MFYLIKNLLLYPLKGEKEFASGFWMAAQLSKEIMEKRSIQKSMWKRSDQEIFNVFKKV
jgi:hypothetical protein